MGGHVSEDRRTDVQTGRVASECDDLRMCCFSSSEIHGCCDMLCLVTISHTPYHRQLIRPTIYGFTTVQYQSINQSIIQTVVTQNLL